MGTPQITKQLNTYIVRLKEAVKPEKVILFGSFARGSAHSSSDIDVLVVSTKQNKNKRHEEYNLFKLHDGLNTNHEFHVFSASQKEFEEAKPWSTLSEIKKEGIVLYSSY